MFHHSMEHARYKVFVGAAAKSLAQSKECRLVNKTPNTGLFRVCKTKTDVNLEFLVATYLYLYQLRTTLCKHITLYHVSFYFSMVAWGALIPRIRVTYRWAKHNTNNTAPYNLCVQRGITTRESYDTIYILVSKPRSVSQINQPNYAVKITIIWPVNKNAPPAKSYIFFLLHDHDN